MYKILAIAFLIGMTSFSLKAQDNSGSELVIIRVIEIKTGYSGGLEPIIHITEVDGLYRVVELEEHSKNYLSNPTDNQRKIHEELKKYLKKGFEITEHAKSLEGGSVWIEDYVLIKK